MGPEAPLALNLELDPADVFELLKNIKQRARRYSFETAVYSFSQTVLNICAEFTAFTAASHEVKKVLCIYQQPVQLCASQHVRMKKKVLTRGTIVAYLLPSNSLSVLYFGAL